MTENDFPDVTPDEAGSAVAVFQNHGVPLSPLAEMDSVQWFQAYQDDIKKICETLAVGTKHRAAQVFRLMLYARAVGVDYAIVLEKCFVLEGKIGMSSEFMHRLARRAGLRIRPLDWTDEVCRLEISAEGEEPQFYEWTWAMAERAGLHRKDNWKSYPRQMLRHRATAEAIRFYAPEVLMGGLLDDEIQPLHVPFDSGADDLNTLLEDDDAEDGTGLPDGDHGPQADDAPVPAAQPDLEGGGGQGEVFGGDAT